MSFAIPVKRLRETSCWLAFFHPSPSYPFHVLLVAKRSYRSLLEIPAQDADFLPDLFREVQSLVRQYHLDRIGYRLIVNGGPYQDVPILHFHLISEQPLPGDAV